MSDDMITLTGKFLIRRSMTTDGKPILVIAGSAFPDCPIEEFDKRDEMWGAKLLVVESARFVNTNELSFSPEDFLENESEEASKKNWTRKGNK